VAPSVPDSAKPARPVRRPAAPKRAPGGASRRASSFAERWAEVDGELAEPEDPVQAELQLCARLGAHPDALSHKDARTVPAEGLAPRSRFQAWRRRHCANDG
jgi:hypothetical protein